VRPVWTGVSWVESRCGALSGYPDKAQRPVKGTVYNASLVNCYIDADTTNGNMPVSGVCNGSSWATAGSYL